MNRRVTVWTATLLLSGVLATSASAATCRKKITNFWGFEGPPASCYVVISPPLPVVLIGQIIRECDDSSWSWGRTDCTNPAAKTIEYEECDNCETSLRVGPSENDEQPATDACEVVAAEPAPY